MKPYLFVLALFIGATWSEQATALGRDGHEAVCYIAYSHLTESVRSRVNDLISLDPIFSKNDDPGKAFAESCSWADDIKPARWSEHFVNVPRDTVEITSLDCPLADTCLFSAILKDSAKLQDNSVSNDERLASLKFIGHWMGDLHQPLHIGFKEDRGGNDIKVGNLPGCKNLHAAWDYCIVEYGMKVMKVPNGKRLGEELNQRTTWFLSAAEVYSWDLSEYKRSSSLLTWANDVYKVTLDPSTGYCTSPDGWTAYCKEWEEGSVTLFSEDRLKANYPVSLALIELAGLRLAQILNHDLEQ